jgi:methyl-accepting chemotaxis protein
MKLYRNLRISAKLIIGFLVVAIIAAVVGVVGLININKINKADTMLYEKNTLGISYSADASTYFQRLRYNALELTILDTAEAKKENTDKITEFCGTIDELLLKYRNVIESDDDIAAYDSLNAKWEEYKNYMQDVIKYSNAGQDAEAKNVIIVETDKVGTEIREELELIVEDNAAEAEQRSLNNDTTAARAFTMLIIVIAVGVILSIALGIYISRLISIPIQKLTKASDKLAQGDVNNISIEINSKDETGMLAASFKKMIENIHNQALSVEMLADGDLTVEVPISSANDMLGNKLSEMVKKNNEVLSNIYSASEQVAAGAKQVSDSSVLLSEGATEQASAIQELTASIEEISSETGMNAQNANEANKLAEEAKSNAKQGNYQMKEMLKAMDEISESSTNISKVIKVIDDIAFQTNILALNAAIEAARAGQHGKGFAVVAEEVRNLAARSANAAKETTEMIEGSIKKSAGGTKIAKDTAQALDRIVSDIEQVATLVGSIANASNEQAIGIKQINQGIMQVSQVVQSNSATSEESAAASEELSSQAILLKETVNQFKVKKNASTNYKYDNLPPDVAKMLDNMSAKTNNNSEQIPESYDKASATKPKIALSDTEFGKY